MPVMHVEQAAKCLHLGGIEFALVGDVPHPKFWPEHDPEDKPGKA